MTPSSPPVESSPNPEAPAAGRLRSRRNALKHGFTGSGRVLPPDMEAEVLAELAIFEKQFRPRNDYEKRLVEQAALASVRKVRLLSAELKHTADRSRRALAAWDAERDDRLAALVARLDDEPAEAVRLLRRFADGCDWLGDAWSELADALDRHGFWDDSQARRALRLLGLAKPPGAHSAPADFAIWKAILALRFPHHPEAVRRLLHTEATPDRLARWLPDPVAARSLLASLAAQHHAELAAEGDHLWNQLDAPERSESPDRSLFDPGPEYARLHRYLVEADRMQRRALASLALLRRNAPDHLRLPDPDPSPQPLPVTPPPPSIPEPASTTPNHEPPPQTLPATQRLFQKTQAAALGGRL